MMAYIMSTGNSYILQKDHPAENSMDQDICKAVEDWDIMNAKVTSDIILYISNTIHVKILEHGTAKEMWELLWTEYGTPSVVVVFSLFKFGLDLHNPSDQHSRKVLDQLQMYFVELNNARFQLPTKTQIMLLLTKLHPNMEVVAWKVTTNRIMDTTTFRSIQKLIILLFYKQCTIWHGQAA